MTSQPDTSEILGRAMMILTRVYTAEGAALWMNEPNELLGGRRAIDVIAAGDGERVVKLALTIVNCDEV